MKAKLIVPFVLFLTVGVVSANAQNIHKTARHERERIAQGNHNGELTKGERHKLNAEQKDIHEDMREAKKDGHVTRNERKEIRHDERKASRDIYRDKHNNRKAKV